MFVELVPTTTGIKRGVEKDLGGSFDTIEKKGTSVFSKIGKLAKGAAVAAAAGAATLAGIAIKGGFSRLLNIEDATAKLKGLGNSTQTVTTIMDNALASVKGTAFGLDAAATVAAGAVAAGIKPGTQLSGVLKTIADTATIAGKSMQDTGQIFNSVAAKGKLQGDDLMQLQAAGVPVLAFLAKHYGITAQAASKMVSDGKVDFENFAAAMQENLGGAALDSGNTTRGAFANMLAALSRTGVALIENVFPMFKTTFQGITVWLDDLTGNLAPFRKAVMAAFSVVATGDFNASIREALGVNEDSPLVGVLVKAHDLTKEVAGGFRAMFAAFKAGDGDVTSSGFAGFMEQVGNAARTLWDAIAPLAPQVIELWSTFSPLGLILGQLGPVLGDLAASLAVVLGGAITALAPILLDLVRVVGDVLVAALSQAVSFLRDLAGWMAENQQWVGLIASSLAGMAAGILLVVGAIKVWRAITIAFTAVQAILSAVLTANPIGIIIVAIGALVGAIIWLATQTTFFQDAWAAVSSWFADAWDNIVGFVTDAINNVVSFVKDHWGLLLSLLIGPLGLVIQWIVDNWSGIADFFATVWNNVVAVFTAVGAAIGAVFSWLYGHIIYPIIVGIMIYIGLWAALIQWLWEVAVAPVLGAIGALFTWLYAAVIQPVFAAIAAVFTWVYQSIIKPIFDGIATAIGVVASIIGTVLGVIASVWNTVWSGISAFFGIIWGAIVWYVTTYINIVSTIITTVVGVIASIWNSVWSGISSFFGMIWGGIVSAVKSFGGFFKSAFDGIAGFVTNAFSGVLGAVKGPLNGLIGIINGAIDALNSVSVKIPAWVPIVGGQTFGLHLPKIPRLAEGAFINATPGGSIVNVGEGRYDEAVVPLTPDVKAAFKGKTTGDDLEHRTEDEGPTDLSDSTIEKLARALAGYARPLSRQGAVL